MGEQGLHMSTKVGPRRVRVKEIQRKEALLFYFILILRISFSNN